MKPIELDSQWIQEVIAGKGFFDWNLAAFENNINIPFPQSQQLEVTLRDESLRDGLGPCPREPNFQEKKNYLSKASWYAQFLTIGIYSSPDGNNLSRNDQETLNLAKWMAIEMPETKPVVLARANTHDINFLERVRQKNPNLVAIIFQDLSEVRRRVEAWGKFEIVLGNLVSNVQEAKDRGISVMAFTENLSITHPDQVKEYVLAMCAVADYIGIADTAGRLVPQGAYFLTQTVKETIEEYRRQAGDTRKIGIVFHGHDDLKNAVPNSMAAIAAGATVVDAVTNGIGERVGNTDLITMVGDIEHHRRVIAKSAKFSYEPRFNLKELEELSQLYARITGVEPGEFHPLVGERAFTTNFGIHAAFYLKVETWAAQMADAGYDRETVTAFKHEVWRLYSALSPADVDKHPDIRVSSLSGAANVILWAFYQNLIEDARNLDKDTPFVQAALSMAKAGWGELSDETLMGLWRQHRP
ncbi:hypothetical protein A2783_02140 [Microgenomates group bacterium RIFCSPHIGHO2_01_FULL_45_11]|nr:MAG: hypothetical protein A2783_02140 [Microgenomates group bacterium RIFCSPHIGHO2_01_FULL_45_11]